MSSSTDVEHQQIQPQPIARFSSFGREAVCATPADSRDESLPQDLITFFAIAQNAGIDFLPITWPRGLSEIGTGAAAKIRESLLHLQMSFAFKVVKDAEWIERIDESQRPVQINIRFKELISEIGILGHPAVQRHPNIAPLLGICWDILPGGRVWPVLIFEKTPWGDLWSFARATAGLDIGMNTRLKLCSDIAAAIRDLHQNNIIHGDIKPQNVLIFKDDSGMYVAKIADFGYSNIFKENSRFAMPMTEPWEAPEWGERYQFSFHEAKKMDAYSFGMLCLWLILYMSLDSPEAIVGKFEDLSERSGDIYAAATGLIESYVGLQTLQKEKLDKFFSLTLINDPNLRSFDFDQFLSCLTMDGSSTSHIHSNAALSNTVISPTFSVSKSAYQLFQADIRVRAYIARALEEHMERILNDQAVRHCAFQLALCYKIGFGVRKNDRYIKYLSQSGLNDSDLEQEIKKMGETQLPNETLWGLFFGGYIVFPTFYDMDVKKEELEKIIHDSRRELADVQFEVPEEITLVLQSHLALALSDQGRWKEAEELEVQVMEARKKVLWEGHPSMLASMGNLALTYSNQGRWKEAEELEVQVMELSLKMLGQEHPSTLTSMNNLASTYRNQGRWKEAEELDVQVMETRKRVLGLEHPDVLTSTGNLASTYKDRGQWKEAEKLFAQVIKIRIKVLGQEHPDTLVSIADLASTYRGQGRWKEAEELEVQVMETRKRVLWPEHPDMLTSMADLASTYRGQGRWKEAEELDTQVIETRRRVLGPEHQDTLNSIANLASTYSIQGRWKDAEELDVQVLETRRRMLGPEHPDTLTSIADLASTYTDQGRWKEAEELDTQVIELRKVVLGLEHPETLVNMDSLASTYRNQGRWKEAEELEAKEIEICNRVLGAEHPSTLAIMINLASTYRDQGRWKEAEELEVQVVEIRKRVLGPEHPDTLTSVSNLASTYSERGRWKEAEELEVQMIETSSRVLGPEHPDTLTSMANLASTYRKQGRWKDAEDLEVPVIEASLRVLGEEHPSTLTSMANLAATLKFQGRSSEAVALMAKCVRLRKVKLGTDHPDTLSSIERLREWEGRDTYLAIAEE